MKRDESREQEQPLLRAVGLEKLYQVRRRKMMGLRYETMDLRAVDGVSFELRVGETLGIVGESGCGKSTLARLLVGLEEATAGAAYFKDQDILQMSTRQLQLMRRHVQMIFQDPYASLNPRMKVKDIIAEPWVVNPDLAPDQGHGSRVAELLERVGLHPSHAERHPHQFSGGQRQRIGIARALALDPDVLICDEPVSALDVSVQAQVVNLLKELQRDLGLAYIFIAHDLSVVRHIADRVAVMYVGKIVETGDSRDIYDRPTHPYTQALLSAVPVPDPDQRNRRERILIEGELPDMTTPPSGCSFRGRCWKAESRCAEDEPDLIDRFDHGHPSRCFLATEDVHAPT